MRIEWERQLWRLGGVTALPTASTRPDDPAVFRVEHLPGSERGPMIDRDGRPVRNWADPWAVLLYGPDGEPLTERNPAADRVPVLGPDDLVRLAFDDDLDTDRRKRLMRARRALADMAAAVMIEPDGAGCGWDRPKAWRGGRVGLSLLCRDPVVALPALTAPGRSPRRAPCGYSVGGGFSSPGD